jgi:hypothetical protein
VVVTDQTGARKPGAHIAAFGQATGSHFEATADASGHAVIHLDRGNYELRVRVAGFQLWKEKEVEVDTETHKSVTLAIENELPCLSFCGDQPPEIPLERQTVAADIPLMPLQQFFPPAKPFRRRAHWF